MTVLSQKPKRPAIACEPLRLPPPSAFASVSEKRVPRRLGTCKYVQQRLGSPPPKRYRQRAAARAKPVAQLRPQPYRLPVAIVAPNINFDLLRHNRTIFDCTRVGKIVVAL